MGINFSTFAPEDGSKRERCCVTEGWAGVIIPTYGVRGLRGKRAEWVMWDVQIEEGAMKGGGVLSWCTVKAKRLKNDNSRP